MHLYSIHLDEEDGEYEIVIRSQFEHWVHVMGRTWFVMTEKSLEEANNLLVPCSIMTHKHHIMVELDDNDLTEMNGWLPQYVWSWIQRARIMMKMETEEHPQYHLYMEFYSSVIPGYEPNRVRSIKQIDEILEKAGIEPAEAELCRNRMIDNFIKKQKLHAERGDA